MRNLAKSWPAYNKWNWDYLKEVAGSKRLGIYNNVKSDAYTPLTKRMTTPRSASTLI